MSMRRATGDLLIRHLIGFAVNFVGTVVLARALGPALWGVFNVGYVAQFIVHGLLERGAVGYLIQRPAEPRQVELGVVLGVQVVLGAFAALLAVATAGVAAEVFDAPPLAALLWSVAIALFAYALRAVPLGMLERRIEYRHVAVVEVSDIATFNVLAVVAVAAGFGVWSLVLATAARAIVSGILAWRLAGMRPVFASSSAVLREFGRFALPYSGTNAIAYLNGAAAPLLVGLLAGARQFGILQVAYTLIAYPQVLNGILGRVAFPVYSRMSSDDGQMRESVSRATSRAIAFVGAGTIMTATSSPIWVPALYGQDWLDVPPIMLAIAPALGIGTAFTFVIAALNARGHATAVLGVSIAFGAFYWTGAAALVPIVGAMGLPIAYSLASVTFIGFLLIYRRLSGRLRIRRALVQYGASACIVLGFSAWHTSDSGTLAPWISTAVVALLLLSYLDPRAVRSWLSGLAHRRSGDRA